MNITIKHKWFYCVIIQNSLTQFFLSDVRKQRSNHAVKLLSMYKQEQNVKKLDCKHKRAPRQRMTTANKTQAFLTLKSEG